MAAKFALEDDLGPTKTLVVEYGRWELRWILVCDDMGGVLDVLPGSLPDDEVDVYRAYVLAEAFPSLLSPPSSTATIATEARLAFHARQLRRLPAALSCEFIETLVASSSSNKIEVEVALTGPEDLEQLGDAPPPLAHLVFETRRDDLVCLGTTIHGLPAERLPATTSGFRCPTYDTNLDAFRHACRQAIVEPWRRRREIADEFARLYAVLDFDDLDFSRLQLLVQLHHDFKKRLAILDVAFGPDFPAKPPMVRVRDFRGSNEIRELDRALFR